MNDTFERVATELFLKHDAELEKNLELIERMAQGCIALALRVIALEVKVKELESQRA